MMYSLIERKSRNSQEMAADQTKEVKVVLSNPTEIKALTGEKPPRRRGTRKSVQRGGADITPESGRVSDLGGSLSPQEAAVAEGPRLTKLEAPSVPVGTSTPVSGEGRGAPIIGGSGEPISPLAVASSITPPTQVLPTLATTTVSGGGVAHSSIVIGGKRGVPTVNTVPEAKILPTKRRLTGAPAAVTMKKPKFKVAEQKMNAQGLSASAGEGSAEGVRDGGGAVKQTRRFKERKIKLTVKSSKVSRLYRHKIKAQVRAMGLKEIKKLLLKKGVIKPEAADKLPEEMMRDMLRDYLLLQANE